MKKKLTYLTVFCKYAKRFFLILEVLLFIGNVNGQNKTIQKKQTPTRINKTTKTNNTPSYLTTSFDTNLTKIPIGFKGHNPIELFDNLEKKSIALSKGEFETTQQFEERQKIEKLKPIIGKLTEESLFAFKPTELKVHYTGFKYNADIQELEFAIELESYANYKNQRFKFDTSRNGVELSKKIKEKRNYNGMNSFGVSAEISSEISNVYSLLFKNWKKFVLGSSTIDLIKFNFKVNPTIAKQIKEQSLIQNNSIISALFIGTLTMPLVYKGYYYSGKPTLSNTFETEEFINYMNLNLNEIWLYNKSTGEIYTKKRENAKMVCKAECNFVDNRELLIDFPVLESSKFNEEGTISFKIEVNSSGDIVFIKRNIDYSGENVTYSETIPPTTIKNETLINEAKEIVRNLRFSPIKSNLNYSKGSVTLSFSKIQN